MNAAAHRSETATATDSNRAQAAYFVREMEHQIALLEEDAAKLRVQLAQHQHRKQVMQAQRVQYELRQLALQRREILDMVAALNSRFTP